jgi:cytosine/creatinine deaminase
MEVIVPQKPYNVFSLFAFSYQTSRIHSMKKDSFLESAIEEAKAGLAEGGIPIGSVLAYKNSIIGRGHNRRIQKGSTILHAEIDAIENSGRESTHLFKESTLYTTLSPCSMCTGAILLYKIPHVVIGENINLMNHSQCDYGF